MVSSFNRGPSFNKDEISKISYRTNIPEVTLLAMLRFDHVTITQASWLLNVEKAKLRARIKNKKLLGAKYFPSEHSDGIWFVKIDDTFLKLLLTKTEYVFYKSNLKSKNDKIQLQIDRPSKA